jgi:hypothetical protein
MLTTTTTTTTTTLRRIISEEKKIQLQMNYYLFSNKRKIYLFNCRRKKKNIKLKPNFLILSNNLVYPFFFFLSFLFFIDYLYRIVKDDYHQPLVALPQKEKK